jgi:hypothetical protein
MFRWLRKRQDKRDVRDKLRYDVMGLASKIGADRIPHKLLDEAMAIWLASGIRAARAYIQATGCSLTVSEHRH